MDALIVLESQVVNVSLSTTAQACAKADSFLYMKPNVGEMLQPRGAFELHLSPALKMKFGPDVVGGYRIW